MGCTDRLLMRFKKETAFGVIPTGTYQELRLTSESLRQETPTVTSEEIRSDRQIGDIIRTGLSVEGDINIELSSTTFDEFFEVALQADTPFGGGPPLFIENGVLEQTFTIEKEFTDLTTEFAVYNGMTVNTMNLNVETGAIITGSFGFIGIKEASGSASVATTTTAAGTDEVMNAVDDVTAFLEGGVSFDITQFSFAINNNVRQRQQVATLGPIGLGCGSLEITGTMRAYFETKAILDKYLNFTESSIKLSVRDAAAKGYDFEFSKLNFTGGQRVAGGQNQDIIADMSWTAKRDPASGKTVKITRF